VFLKGGGGRPSTGGRNNRRSEICLHQRKFRRPSGTKKKRNPVGIGSFGEMGDQGHATHRRKRRRTVATSPSAKGENLLPNRKTSARTWGNRAAEFGKGKGVGERD